MNSKIKHWQIIGIGLVIFDILAINLSYLFGLFLRFDFTYSLIPNIYITTFIKFAPIYTIFSIIIFYIFKMYKSLWRFASDRELFRSIISNVVTSLFHIVVTLAFFHRMPISYYIMGAIIQLVLTTSVRFLYRFVIYLQKNNNSNLKTESLLIVGAGEAGRLLLNDLRKNQNKNYNIEGFIDDNSNKWGRYISDVPILGGRDTIFENVKKLKIDTIVMAMPSATPSQRQDVLNIIKESGAKLKILPSIPDILQSGNVTTKNLRDVQIEDLLQRDAIKINSEDTLNNFRDKVILVTGGGGTIGSELARQVATYKPKKLILFDIYENNAYEIEQELRRRHKDLDLEVLIGSVREVKRLDDIFDKYRPNIVYHAAAHKHVPLMEVSPNEAIKNNVYGTYNTAYAALRYKVEKFILISTDKAVNPTSIMGTTKRICEMIIQSMNNVSKSRDISHLPDLSSLKQQDVKPFDTNFVTSFVAVRFGNVLGSNGSVIPLFKKQIQEGGPVTVTHKDIIRYFMTIQEAVGLIIEAGFKANGGEIFVLDMGEPVKIDTLARNLIKLSGLVPEKDIEIVYTGLRPGEKLYEEKLMSEEGLKKTDNEIIHIAKPLDFDNDEFFEKLEKMSKFAVLNDVENVLSKMSEIVPTYHTSQSDIEENKDKFKKLYEISK